MMTTAYPFNDIYMDRAIHSHLSFLRVARTSCGVVLSGHNFALVLEALVYRLDG